MPEIELHRWLCWLEIALAGLTVVAVALVTAPYGRHSRPGWGPTIPNRLGWLLMELPAAVGFAWIYLQGDLRWQTVPLTLLGLWQLHYLYRTFIFPARLRTSGKRMALVIALLGATFNSLNAYIVARWISQLGSYRVDWLMDPRFVSGLALFLAGWLMHVRADHMLLALRAPGQGGYKIPRGWLYEYVSCPNYLGEIVEWTGFAVATWSLPGLAFALYTAANLAPRAFQHHRWYRTTFDDYPKARKALIPFLA